MSEACGQAPYHLPSLAARRIVVDEDGDVDVALLPSAFPSATPKEKRETNVAKLAQRLPKPFGDGVILCGSHGQR